MPTEGPRMQTDTSTGDRIRRPRRRAVATGVVVLVALLAAGGWWLAERAALASRQAEVAERGADVMPFSLDATTHRFQPTPDGGVQTVTADEPADGKEVELVRAHLREEAERFRQGDFDDPASIHGHDMAGLAVLRAHDGALAVDYLDVPDGGRLVYTTSDPEVLEALHVWFDVQIRDHGAHAGRG